MNSGNEELLEFSNENKEVQEFVPELIVKKKHKNHKVIVKEATFKTESEEDDDDFDPFSNESKISKPAKPLGNLKLKPVSRKPIAEVKTESFETNAIDDDCDLQEKKPSEVEVQVKLENLKKENANDDDDSEDESLSLVKRKIQKNIGRTKKTKIKDFPKKNEDKFVKPIKKRAYKAESEQETDDDDDDDRPSDEEPEKKKNMESRPYKGPQITADLRYTCLHDECKAVGIFDSAFSFVDHMESIHIKTLSIVRIRNFVPWERETGAIVKIHPKKLHNLINCEKCKKQYSSHDGLKRHIRLGKCDSVKENYICKICQLEFKRADLRILHMKLVHPHEKMENLCKCLICDQQFDTKEATTEHYTNVHLNNFSCKYCTKLYSSAICLLEHIRSQHENFGLICDICGKVTRCVRELKNHKEIHITDPNVKCTECDQMFISETKMLHHREIVHNPGHFECDVCKCVYPTAKKLQRHHYLKHSEKNYRCHLCGKGFLANGEFNNHLLWHEGKWKPKKKIWKPQKEKNHACKLCDFKTARSYSLKCHVKRIHMGEKWRPKKEHFVCEICNKEFSEKRFYVKHMSRKTVHMVHKCDKCGIEVSGLDSFREHRKIHIKKLPCQTFNSLENIEHSM